MKPRYLLLALALVLPVSFALADGASPQPPKRILFFSKSTGYEHSVIKNPLLPFTPGTGSEVAGLAFTVLQQLGAKNNIVFVFSKDGSLFTPAYLAQFDAIYFHTTGTLTEVGNDGNPAMTPAGKQALLDAIAGGKAFIGTHCAADTFHSPGSEEIPNFKGVLVDRYHNDGDKADPYIKMLGGEFIIHGQQQPSHLIVADPNFPGMSGVPADNDMKEEWYSLKDFAPDIHVLLVNSTAGMDGNPYHRPNYPSTWARMYGKGRVFYSSLGHRDDMWTSALFQSVLMGGINWALGRVDADISPNLVQVAPEASTLPPVPPDPTAH